MKFTDEQLGALREKIENDGEISKKRLLHILAVEDAAAKLADLYIPEKNDVLRAAALLHDITKEYPAEKQVEICLRHGYEPTDEISSPKLFHAKTAAWLIPEIYPEFADDEVVEAVRWHTTGRAGMTLTEKIIYFADYIDESRTFPDCVTLRNLFWKAEPEKMPQGERILHLNKLIKTSYEMTINGLSEEGRPVDANTTAALDDITKEINEGRKNMKKDIENIEEFEEEIKKMPPLSAKEPDDLAAYIAEVLDGKKAQDIVNLKVADKTVIADNFVLCTGGSSTQVRALTDEVEYRVKLRGVEPIRVEGRDNNAWIIMDYGSVLVHIFSREARAFYDLEKLYN